MSYVERGEPGAADGFEDRDYARVGIEAEQAKGWRRWAIEPLDAIRWLKAHVSDPVTATQWGTAGVRPDLVAKMVTAGISSSMAAQWHEFGANAERALSEHAAGRTPSDFKDHLQISQSRAIYRPSAVTRGLRASVVTEAAPELEDGEVPSSFKKFGTVHMGYLQLAWVDSAAEQWASAGIDAFDARDWLALGVRPREAARCERAGMSATDTLLQWLRAGFEPAEFADWLGAGLTPEEAVAQRSEGVTAEQAAVMRSLRRTED